VLAAVREKWAQVRPMFGGATALVPMNAVVLNVAQMEEMAATANKRRRLN